MKYNFLLILLLLSTVGATTIVFEDSTHLHKLLCCDSEGECEILRDLSYVGEGSGNDDYFFRFNNVTLSNVTVCFERGNKYDVDPGNWAFTNLKTVGLTGFILVITIIIIYLILRKTSNFRK